MRTAAVARFLCAAALALASSALPRAAGVANIDTGGFAKDGKTTYCEGVHHDQGPLVFEELETSSAGKCPVTVTLNVSSTSIASVKKQITVDWSASRARRDLATSLFPRAVNATTGVPERIIASLLRACKSGSNCAKASEVVVPAAVSTSVWTTTGAFNGAGNKKLRSYVFQFPTEGEYVIVAKIVLPGDAALNISATEFVTFHSVKVGSAVATVATVATVAPGTVKPSEASLSNDTVLKTTFDNEPVAKSSGASSRLGVEAQDSKNTELTSSDSSSSKGSSTNVIVLGGIAGLGFIIAIAYFATVQKEKDRNSRVPPRRSDIDDAQIYRLTDIRVPSQQYAHQPQMQSMDSMQSMQYLAPVVPPAAHKARLAHNHHHQRQQPWKAPPPDPKGRSSEVPPLNQHHHDHRDDDLGLTYTGEGSSIDSFDDLLVSQATSFGGLHDSRIALPIQPRHRRSSSASSYADALSDDDSDEDDFPSSSRMFSEANAAPKYAPQTKPAQPRDTGLMSFDDLQSSQHSTYSWVDSERDTRLSELSDFGDLSSIHEKWTQK